MQWYTHPFWDVWYLGLYAVASFKMCGASAFMQWYLLVCFCLSCSGKDHESPTTYVWVSDFATYSLIVLLSFLFFFGGGGCVGGGRGIVKMAGVRRDVLWNFYYFLKNTHTEKIVDELSAENQILKIQVWIKWAKWIYHGQSVYFVSYGQTFFFLGGGGLLWLVCFVSSFFTPKVLLVITKMISL